MLNCPMKNERENQYRSLEKFTTEIHQEIMGATSALGWTMKSIEIDGDNRLVCPYDSCHQIGKKILDQHLESCQWKQEGYNEFDIPLPESSLPLKSYSSIKLDLALQNSILNEAKKTEPTMKIESYECPTWHKLCLGEQIIPRTSNRILTNFTCDERKVLYEYVVSNTVKPDIGHDIADIKKLKSEDKEDKKLSFLELLIQERNLKRRRAKHRGVHTNKKSHTEILREIIHQQMEMYMDYITETRPTNATTKTTTITEIQSSDRKHEDPSDYRKSLNSRNNQKDEYFEKSYASSAKDSGQREKYSRSSTESRKTHKHRKHKRSRSRERDRSKKSKHGSSRTYKKSHIKSYESEKSFDSNSYSKRDIDRRENREKLIL